MSSLSVSRKTLLGEPCCTAWTNIPRSPYVYEHLVMVDAEKVMPILSSKTSLETRDSNQQKISILAFGLGTSYNRTHSGWFCSLGVFFLVCFSFVFAHDIIGWVGPIPRGRCHCYIRGPKGPWRPISWMHLMCLCVPGKATLVGTYFWKNTNVVGTLCFIWRFKICFRVRIRVRLEWGYGLGVDVNL